MADNHDIRNDMNVPHRPMGPYGGMPGMYGRPGMYGGPGMMRPGGGFWRYGRIFKPNDYGEVVSRASEDSFFDMRRQIRAELREKYPKMSTSLVELVSFLKAAGKHPIRAFIGNLKRDKNPDLSALAKKYH